MNGPAVAARMSPATPLPPMPMTTTCSMRSRSGRSSRPWARTAASCTCSGGPAAAASMPSESSCSEGSPTGTALRAGVERRADRLTLDLGHDAPVLGAVDRLGLVDQHHRDVVTHDVAPLQARVVEGVLVGEVVER